MRTVVKRRFVWEKVMKESAKFSKLLHLTLIRQEIREVFRILVPLGLCLTAYSAVAALIGMADWTDSFACTLLDSGWTFAVVAFFIAAYVLSVHRFYRKLYSSEGYLAFSLPVSPVWYLGADLIAGVLALLCATVWSVLSYSILKGEPAYLAILAFFRSLNASEVLIYFVALPLFAADLILHFCMSFALGLLAGTHRKIVGFVVYLISGFFLYQLAIFCFVWLALGSFNGGLNPISFLPVLAEAVLAIALFWGSAVILKRKLNLE